VPGQLDDARLVFLRVHARDMEPGRLEVGAEGRVHPVTAVVRLVARLAAVELSGQGSGPYRDPSFDPPADVTRERRDCKRLGFRIRLGVVGVPVPEDVAHVLDNDVLEAASGADEGHAALARVANRLERRVHVPVRARRSNPEAVVPRKGFNCELVGRDPVRVDPRVRETAVGGRVRLVSGVVVADDRYSSGYDSSHTTGSMYAVTQSRLATALAMFVVLLSGCGDSEGTPAASDTGWTNYVPLAHPDSLSDLSHEDRELDLEALSEDALEPTALASLLEEARFEGGVEIEYTGRTRLYSHVVTRTLAFAAPPGASAYLEWLDQNASDILGPVESKQTLSVGSDGVLLLQQGCNCHSDLPTYLAAWRDGAVVRTLLADGAGVNARRVTALARELG
jgi:hypothetical protein